jgi:hypothetical protein
MSHYVHHVPGRLRVKCALIKRNEARAAAVRELLVAVRGVVACEVKAITGSVVARYDPALVNAPALVELLEAEGFISGPARRIDDSAAPHSKVASVTGRVAKAVGGVLLEKLVEHSAVALIGAIL